MNISWCQRGASQAALMALIFGALSDDVLAFNPDTKCVTDETLAEGPSVLGLSVAPDGTIYYADYFGNAFGVLNSQNWPSPLLMDLKSPLAVEAAGGRVYFTEAGTALGLYHDGALSVFDPVSGERTVIYDRLHYPNSLFVDSSDNVYVLEAGRFSTSFGGNSRLVKFAPGATEPEEIIPDIWTPAAVVINSEGTILVGSFGATIPGNSGLLVAYPLGQLPVTVAEGMPSIQDMAIDEMDNLYIASFATDGGPMEAVSYLANGSSILQPLKLGTHAWCVALDGHKQIYYSTGRSSQSIGRLIFCAPPPLRISLDQPANHASLLTPGTIRLEASTEDRDGIVTNVTFFANDINLGESWGAPFSIEWMDPPPNFYALYAVARDDVGRWATSAPVTVRIRTSDQQGGAVVWVFHDEDPDWTNPPFADTLTVLDEFGQPGFTMGGFNTSQTIGANRSMVATKDDGSVLVCENVANRLSKLDGAGQLLFSLARPITAVDVTADGVIFALEDHSGTIFGENLLRLSPDGLVLDQAPVGGFDLVIDEEREGIFVVGADIKYVDYNLQTRWSLDPIPWCAVSVDLWSDGSAWVAEREHPEVFGSSNRLLRVSPEGTILKVIELSYSPFCVRVDLVDKSIYVAGDHLYKYDAEGNQLFAGDLGQSLGSFQTGWSLAVEPGAAVWVGTFRDVRKFGSNGDLLFNGNPFSYPSDTFLAVIPDLRLVPPVIVSQPTPQSVTVGSNATFTVAAAGTGPLRYQWYKNGVLLMNDAKISGATSSTLLLRNVRATDAGKLTVSVSNRVDKTISAEAQLTVRPPALEAERFGDVLLLLWPASGSDVVLESSSAFSSQAWSPLSEPPLLLQDQQVVPLHMSGPQRFYRLRLVTP